MLFFSFILFAFVPEGKKPRTAFMFNPVNQKLAVALKALVTELPFMWFLLYFLAGAATSAASHRCGPLRVPHTRFLGSKTRSLSFTQRLHSCTYMLFCVFRTSDTTFILLGRGFTITQFLLNPLLISVTHSPFSPQHGSMAALLLLADTAVRSLGASLPCSASVPFAQCCCS